MPFSFDTRLGKAMQYENFSCIHNTISSHIGLASCHFQSVLIWKCKNNKEHIRLVPSCVNRRPIWYETNSMWNKNGIYIYHVNHDYREWQLHTQEFHKISMCILRLKKIFFSTFKQRNHRPCTCANCGLIGLYTQDLVKNCYTLQTGRQQSLNDHYLQSQDRQDPK